MSHLSKIQLTIKDLDALGDAAQRLGLELIRHQKTYKWFGRSVGDYPLPEGLTVEDLGRCDHAIRIPNNADAYEIGVKKMPDGSFSLLWDFWRGGFGLAERIGNKTEKLKQAYAVAAAALAARKKGYSVIERKTTEGIRLNIRVP